jgi:tetratricopeptide (TPR) repeat protein
MASTPEQNALEWIAKGDKHMKKSFFSTFDPYSAQECYKKAANWYKLQQQWDKAGAMLEKAAACFIALGSSATWQNSAAEMYLAAALAYENGTIANARPILKSAITLFVDLGKFDKAGKAMEDLAKIEAAEGDITDALTNLCSAIDCLKIAKGSNASSRCRKKAIQMACNNNQFQIAATLFEAIATTECSKEQIIEAYFCASLCHIALSEKNTIATSKCLIRFRAASTDFACSAEVLFVDEIIKSIETNDGTVFEAAAKIFKKHRRSASDSSKILTQIIKFILKDGDNLLKKEEFDWSSISDSISESSSESSSE